MSLDWISDLERKVESAVRELEAARKENRALKKKVQRLQQQLRVDQRSSDAEAAWQKERRLVRRRVAKLAESLEKLL